MGSRHTISPQGCSRFSTKSDFNRHSAIPQSYEKGSGLLNTIPRENRPVDSERMEIFGRMACGVAHDFNNLLTGIMLYSDLLIAELESNSKLRGYSEEIRRVGLEGAALMQRLLPVAQLETRVVSWN